MPGSSPGGCGDGAASTNATDSSRVPASTPRPDLERVVGGHAVLVQPLPLDIVLGHRDQRTGIGAGVAAPDGEPLDEGVVDADLDLVFVLGDAVYRLDGLVALEPDGEHVLAVQGKVMAHGQPAAGREGQVFAGPHVAPLVPHLVDLHDRTDVGAADRRPADLGRGGHVAGHQPRRDRQHVGVVVEAEPGHVRRQQVFAADLEAQQVFDGVDVLDAVQAPRRHPPGVGVGRRRAVERPFEGRHEGVQRRRAGPRAALGGHLAGAQLVDDLLENGSMGRGPGRVHPVEGQAAGLQPLVVAGDAVAVEELAGRRVGLALTARRGRRPGRERRSRRRRRNDASCEHDRLCLQQPRLSRSRRRQYNADTTATARRKAER